MKDIRRALIIACVFSALGCLSFIITSFNLGYALHVMDQRAPVENWRYFRVSIQLNIFRELMAAVWFFVPTALLVWAIRRARKVGDGVQP